MVPDSVKWVISDFLDEAIIVDKLPGVSTFNDTESSAKQLENIKHNTNKRMYLFAIDDVMNVFIFLLS